MKIEYGKWLIRAFGFSLFVVAASLFFQGIVNIGSGVNEGMWGIYIGWDNAQDNLLITGVMQDSPAERVGLKSGDRVTESNGVPLTRENYMDLLGARVINISRTLTILRDGTIKNIVMVKEMTSFYKRFLQVIFRLLIPLTVMIYALVGLWIVFKSPTFTANLIALVCFFMATVFSFSF
ncbi:MAG: PDZ domain-containing protein, partial [bacterium]|nr:PDZ domain-containing protein [bacterium]